MGSQPYRYDWYQTASHIIITIMVKEARRHAYSVNIKDDQNFCCSITPPEQSGDPKTVDLRLAHPVEEDEPVTKVTQSKIEVKLKKREGIQWSKLEADPNSPDAKANVISSHHPEVAAADTTPLSYPSSSQYQHNWDAISKEIDEELKDEKPEGDQALQELFQKIYADGSDEHKKAMLKSFQESAGTVLSTNWDEVGKEKVDVKPPDGAEYRPHKSY